MTGAPVIDPARATLYLDAMVMRDDEPRHEIYALALADGSIELGWPVDVATALKGSFIPSVQNERGALALFAGRVYVPTAGHYGDCGDYHGFVVGVSETDPAKVESFATRARGGGIWGQGGVVGDGNRCSLRPATRSTRARGAMAKPSCGFGPGLARSVDPRDYFAPANWSFLDGADRDLGGTAPLLDVPSAKAFEGAIFAVGKSGDAYLLDRDVSADATRFRPRMVMANVTMASPAVWRAGDAVFVALQGYGANCPPTRRGRDWSRSRSASILRLRSKPPGARRFPATAGSPIVTTTDGTANPIVFIVGAEADNRLYAFRAHGRTHRVRRRSICAASADMRRSSPPATGSMPRAADTYAFGF